MPNQLRTTCLAVLICGMWSASGCCKPGPTADDRVRGLLSDDGVRVLQTAVRVETYRVASPRRGAGDGTSPADPAATATNPATAPAVVGGYVAVARGPDRDAGFARRLSAVLLDPGTYSFDSAKGCVFTPAVAFRAVAADGRSADVVLCFACRELRVTVPPAAGGPAAPHVATEDFDNANAAIVRLAKEAFPADAQIGGLRE